MIVPPTGATMRGGVPIHPAAGATGSVPARNHSARPGSTSPAKATSVWTSPGDGVGGALGRLAPDPSSRCAL